MQLIKQSHKILNISGTNEILELAGRTCYKSEDKITEGSANKFIDKILNQYHHESVIEHSLITVKFITNRGVTHELVRHRLASFSQESTRYVKYNQHDMEFILPVWFNKDVQNNLMRLSENPQHSFTMDNLVYTWYEAMRNAEATYANLMKNGWKAQQARSVLPNSLKTEIVVSANFREWRHIFKMRTAKNAHPQIRELMIPLLNELKEKVPIIFDDIEPYIKEK